MIHKYLFLSILAGFAMLISANNAIARSHLKTEVLRNVQANARCPYRVVLHGKLENTSNSQMTVKYAFYQSTTTRQRYKRLHPVKTITLRPGVRRRIMVTVTFKSYFNGGVILRAWPVRGLIPSSMVQSRVARVRVNCTNSRPDLSVYVSPIIAKGGRYPTTITISVKNVGMAAAQGQRIIVTVKDYSHTTLFTIPAREVGTILPMSSKAFVRLFRFPTSLPAGKYGVCANIAAAPYETFYYNNEHCSYFYHLGRKARDKADIKVTIVTRNRRFPTIILGKKYRFRVKLENKGSKRSPSGIIHLFGKNIPFRPSSFRFPPLDPGAARIVNATIYPSRSTEKTLGLLCAEYRSRPSIDANGLNNKSCVNVRNFKPKPDLTGRIIGVQARFGIIEYIISVTNGGSYFSPRFGINLQLLTGDSRLLKEVTLTPTALRNNQRKIYRGRIDLTSPRRIRSGRYRFCLLIDKYKKIDESNERNNVICRVIDYRIR